VRGGVVCRNCAESIFKKEEIPANEVQQQIDPTICIGCGLDNGNTELAKLGQLPVCPTCESLFKNRPFPMWIKAALVGMVVLVISVLVWNSRFIFAYRELKCFGSSMDAGDIQQAAEYFVSASRRIPEDEGLQAYGDFYEGILLLNQNKSAEALKLLEGCRGRIDEESGLEDLILNARIGIAFGQGDYDEFLQLALQMSEKYNDSSGYVDQLASAYACKYVETQDEQYKDKSLVTLERANTLVIVNSAEEKAHTEYAQRILHRLHTREIINRDEFNKRYPNGWNVEGEKTP
jgi:hypothetical protein